MSLTPSTFFFLLDQRRDDWLGANNTLTFSTLYIDTVTGVMSRLTRLPTLLHCVRGRKPALPPSLTMLLSR